MRRLGRHCGDVGDGSAKSSTGYIPLCAIVNHLETQHGGATLPNWVEQNLHVIGSKTDIDSFIRVGLKRNGKDVLWSFGDRMLMFWKLCPLRYADRKDADDAGDVSD